MQQGLAHGSGATRPGLSEAPDRSRDGAVRDVLAMLDHAEVQRASLQRSVHERLESRRSLFERGRPRVLRLDGSGPRPPDATGGAFVERYPKIALEGKGEDWPYAGWYVWMMHLSCPHTLPLAYSDESAEREGFATIERMQFSVPLPRPGKADDPEFG